MSDSILTIHGIGEKTAKYFEKLGVFTIGDLVHLFPRSYTSYPDIRPIHTLSDEQTAVVCAKVVRTPRLFKKGNRTILQFEVTDGTGMVIVTFFGVPYLKKEMVPGKELLLFGTFKMIGANYCISQPKILSKQDYEKGHENLLPIYRGTKGLTNNTVCKAMAYVFDTMDDVPDFMPERVLKEHNFLPLCQALKQIHFPADYDEMARARERLSFDEFYLFLAKMKLLKSGLEKKKTIHCISDFSLQAKLIRQLPYELTGGQAKALAEINEDLSCGFQMNRLVQGDVGCGKTILAFLAGLSVIQTGAQVALMAPTEVLANQHYLDLCQLVEKYSLPIKPVYLSGHLKVSEKKSVKQKIRNMEADFIIGTHAVIQKDVVFSNLGLVICDEQHRFGVRQRSDFSLKGNMPHILVMSATPIPRTLGIILYGDLSISLIHELPARRKPIKNTVVGPEYRERIYGFMQKHVLEGQQVYVICPMVEETRLLENENADLDSLEMENVKDYAQKLQTIFPTFSIGILHGKMKSSEKDEVMDRFKKNEIQILVSTTVVEVGVNVPNATVMLIENADRFGLSQLHQLRGRVGRGDKQSYCIFMTGSDSKKSRERLEIMAKTNDGFEIANEDLKQRGPGDFFGLRQSGMPGFEIADIYEDAAMLKFAKNVLDNQTNCHKDEIEQWLDKLQQNAGMKYVDFHQINL
ncbi:MAG: ATP-dependent DNA helicase RecG [Lachnospiraceae bacterium]